MVCAARCGTDRPPTPRAAVWGRPLFDRPNAHIDAADVGRMCSGRMYSNYVT